MRPISSQSIIPRLSLRPLSRPSPRTPHSYDSHTSEEDSEVLSGLYTQRTEACNLLLSQLQASLRRHYGLLTYVESTKVHLTQNVNIARADLESRYHAAMAKLADQYEDSCTQLELAAGERESMLRDKEAELKQCVRHLEQAKTQLELRLRAESKAAFVQLYGDHLAEAKSALMQWTAEIDFGDLLTLPDVENYGENATTQTEEKSSIDLLQSKLVAEFQQLEAKRKALLERSRPFLESSSSPSPSPARTTKRKKPHYHAERTTDTEKMPIDVPPTQDRLHIYRKDAIILDLVKRYKELESLYEWAKHGTASPAVQEISVHTDRLRQRVA